MKKVSIIIVCIFIGTTLITCKSGRRSMKLDEKTKRYWRWNAADATTNPIGINKL